MKLSKFQLFVGVILSCVVAVGWAARDREDVQPSKPVVAASPELDP
jgi:hypothetical protein